MPVFSGAHELASLGYGARLYDPVIGRWGSVDPLAEKYLSFTPYAYVMNNPLKYTDPNGMLITHTDEDGNVIAVYEDGDLGYIGIMMRKQRKMLMPLGKNQEILVGAEKRWGKRNTGMNLLYRGQIEPAMI